MLIADFTDDLLIMRFPWFHLIAATLIIACDGEKVQQLSQDVQAVKTDQRILRTEVQATSDQARILQTSVAAMGTGFNVLSDTVVQQDTRVDRVESSNQQIRKQVAKISGSSFRGPAAAKATPDIVGTYVGARVDTQTMQEMPMRMQWCESEEGSNGYLAPSGQDPDYQAMKCWRFGDVAIFRNETARGPEIRCMRDISIDESGELRALDCDQNGVFYRMTLR